MAKYTRIISIVILENDLKQINFQLRDDIPNIGHPNHWGIFGGGVDEGEDKTSAALREVKEELLIDCDPRKIRFLRSFEIDGGLFHLFHYPIGGQMATAQLQEGQRIGTFSPEQVLAGKIEGHSMVPHHLEMLRWYWNRQH